MFMAMMQVRVVRMGVDQPRMSMDMAVRLARRIVRGVGVAVMEVVGVPVLVLHGRMLVPVLVALGEVQP